jgi:hypothetical protein
MSKLSADIAICCTIASGGQKEKGKKAEQIVVRQRVFSLLPLKTWMSQEKKINHIPILYRAANPFQT